MFLDVLLLLFFDLAYNEEKLFMGRIQVPIFIHLIIFCHFHEFVSRIGNFRLNFGYFGVIIAQVLLHELDLLLKDALNVFLLGNNV